ncbi:MFS transporter [Myroides sp. 1354]|uniref:MFS transporter n=1 Tax=unclassified Myroides TaxID=2642485 RepID=UPI002574E516|nr:MULTISPECIES: MFS transporter [unclassified Myroides]MDM1045355.1 MFS transporter [Myroides sp. R163-1]MDM1056408.1 MFS transporter [Myroides sp. 1354]MDM1069486.1 MFS transporter [Myroides sp. 1372]
MKKYAYVGALGLLSIITTEFGVIGVLPQIASHYQISIDQASWLLSGFALVIALFGPFMTMLTARMEKKTTMLLAIALFSITSFGSVLLPSFGILLILRMIPALLQPVYIANALAIAVNTSPKDQSSNRMSIVFSGITIASFTTIPLATYWTNLVGLQAIFIIQGIISALAFAAIYLVLPKVQGEKTNIKISELNLLKKASFIRSALVNLFVIAMWFSVYSYFADYLNKEKQLSGFEVSLMILLFGVVGVIAMYMGGKILAKGVVFSNVFYVIGAMGIAILLYLSGNNFFLITGLIAIWSLFYTPVFLNVTAFLQRTTAVPFELGSSLSTSLGNLGIAVGTFVGGKVITDYGMQELPLVMLGFAGVSLILIVLVSRKNEIR